MSKGNGVTSIQRPAKHPDNTSLVMVLQALSLSIARTGDILMDIAKAAHVDPVAAPPTRRKRIAQLLDEHADAVRVGAQHVREAL